MAFGRASQTEPVPLGHIVTLLRPQEMHVQGKFTARCTIQGLIVCFCFFSFPFWNTRPQPYIYLFCPNQLKYLVFYIWYKFLGLSTTKTEMHPVLNVRTNHAHGSWTFFCRLPASLAGLVFSLAGHLQNLLSYLSSGQLASSPAARTSLGQIWARM